MMRIACKSTVALVVLAGLSGCFPYTFPRDPPGLVTAQSEKSATIRPGESTRAEIHALLGAPWLSSRFWQVDVYRVSEAQLTPGVFFFVFVPLLPMVENVNWDGYALITYDDTGRVTAIASGEDEENRTRRTPCLHASDMTFATNWNKHPELVLLAGSHRLADFIEVQQKTNACSVIVACEKADCPDQIAIDNRPIDPRFVKLGDCRGTNLEPSGSDNTHVPVLHLLSLAPGKHAVAVSSSKGQGRYASIINCAAGDVRYVRVQSEVIGEPFWWGARELQTTMQVIEDQPESWSDKRVLLWRSSGSSQLFTVGEE